MYLLNETGDKPIEIPYAYSLKCGLRPVRLCDVYPSIQKIVGVSNCASSTIHSVKSLKNRPKLLQK